MPVAVRELELDLDAFEGPFDLLLSLVLREELPLREVDLAEIVISFVEHLEAYAASFGAPVHGGTTVEQVRFSGRGGGRYAVATDRGTWHADNVVVATGPHGTSRVPAGLPRDAVFTSSDYRNPEQLPEGGVLVVGASASGVQIADELNRAGRDVVLAVGSHTRMPRRYRGVDIYWWMETTGRLARTVDDMPDPGAALFWGYARVLRREHGELTPRVIDVDPSDQDWAAACVADLLGGDGEDQVALRGLDLVAHGRVASVLPVAVSADRHAPGSVRRDLPVPARQGVQFPAGAALCVGQHRHHDQTQCRQRHTRGGLRGRMAAVKRPHRVQADERGQREERARDHP